jgi:hypothetical protein
LFSGVFIHAICYGGKTMNKFASKLLDLRDGENLVDAMFFGFALLIFNLLATCVVTTFGTFGLPYYNPLLNL